MARFVFCLMVLFAGAADAADWTSYSNPRFGVTIDVPPGFVNDVPEPANGDGRIFHSADGRAELQVWGNNAVDKDFTTDAAMRMDQDLDNGWIASYTAGGDGWQAYSATQSGHVMYVKSISSCKGKQVLNFRIDYPEEQKKDYDPVVGRLAKSLKAGPATECP